MENTLARYPAHIINGVEIESDKSMDVQSIDPYTGKLLWSTGNANVEIIEEAINSSRDGFRSWSAYSFEDRIAILKRFVDLVNEEKEYLSELVSIESGKPKWEALAEVNSLLGKLDVSIDAYLERNKELRKEVKGKISVTRFRPHGVLVVLGPFNFPLTMANGHIMPALVAGNSVIFKPSEYAPLCGIYMAKMWQKAGLPNGTLNCISGNGFVGKQMADRDDIDGVLFVGSHTAGISILKEKQTKPDQIIALEMGGNSPLLIEDYPSNKLHEVVNIIIQSAFVTSGQRCSSARRLIVNRKYKGIIEELANSIPKIRIGHYASSPEPFYGPMIRPLAASKALSRFTEIVSGGGVPIVQPVISGPYKTLLSPGLIEVDACTNDMDEEIFGPILKVQYYDELNEGIALANATKFGLAAGIVTMDKEKYEKFLREVKAGIINWNQQLTGATKFAPFGGVKGSGNYRPAGYLSADYCVYCTASYEVSPDQIELSKVHGLNEE